MVKTLEYVVATKNGLVKRTFRRACQVAEFFEDKNPDNYKVGKFITVYKRIGSSALRGNIARTLETA
jgi:hypothetical protein